eukprot:m.43896 g.43896  ORF g.43896 m.43896 type:complete len:312 (-) comp10569_c0_seq1:177-1112(-)
MDPTASHLSHATGAFITALKLFISPETYDFENVAHVFVESDALVVAFLFAFLHMATSIIAGPLTNDYGWVDRAWSTVPIFYGWWFAYRGDWNDRSVMMAILVTIWGVRLTFNFIRKDGGQEDYRWKKLRETMSPFLFQLFNVFFIAIFQHLLIFGFISSAYVASRVTDLPLSCTDYTLAAIFVFLVAFEFVSDEQQYNFQKEKYFRIDNNLPMAADYERGFLTGGLFRFSRHPHYFAEHMLWWVFYVFSVVVSGQVLNWTILGPLVLTHLMSESINLTEKISSAKYPDYARYQQTTSRWMPCKPGPSLDEI